MKTRAFGIIGIVWAFALVGCSGSDTTVSTGGDTDAGNGASTSRVDGGGSTGGGSSGGGGTSDAGGGGGSGGDVDSGVPATDAGGGGGGGGDAGGGGADPGTAAGVVTCGNQGACDTSSHTCCLGFSGGAAYTCTAGTSCTGLAAKITCDGPEDCGGQRCCFGFPGGTTCKAACGTQEWDGCHTDSDCTGGTKCLSCTTPDGNFKTKKCTTSC